MKWDELTPRERDALVAEKVMGLVKDDVDSRSFDAAHSGGYYRYTSDISAAWEIVEKMKTKNDFFSLMFAEDGHEWSADFEDVRIDGYAIASTAPEAICLAALKAVGVEV